MKLNSHGCSVHITNPMCGASTCRVAAANIDGTLWRVEIISLQITKSNEQTDGLVQERLNSSASAMKLPFSSTNPSKLADEILWFITQK